MKFSDFSPYLLRFAIEMELQNTNDTKMASIIALKRLKNDPEYYHNKYGYIEPMEKARGPVKYIKKITVGGKTRYFYNEQEWKDYKSEKKTEDKEGWISKLSSLFGFKSRSEAMQKIQSDYKTQEIDKKYNMTWDDWKSHVSEYFNRKDKWDAFFSGKKDEQKGSSEKKTSEKKEKQVKKETKKSLIKLSVMKLIHDLYGNVSQPISEVKESNFETMPEEETENKVKIDKKVAKAINEATPDTRFEKTREAFEVEKPVEGSIDIPVIEFKPKKSSFYIPFFKGGEGNQPIVDVLDYTEVAPRNIYLAKEKEILTKERPSYIPEISDQYFTSNHNKIVFYKLEEDKYIIQTKRLSGIPSDSFAIVNLSVLAATQDYYLKIAKEKAKQYNDEMKKKFPGAKRIKKKTVRTISDKKMSWDQFSLLEFFNGKMSTRDRKPWDIYKQINDDFMQKSSDMQIQFEEFFSAHSKGEETSYGEVGAKDTLLNNYGVKVKRQNGNEITESEINDIKFALDEIFEIFGDRSSMAKNFGLKISHSGDKLMHARKFAGLFFPHFRAIGVTAQSGQSGMGFILAHEWAHFMDYYIGNKNDYHYISDNPNSVAGKIAKTFRNNMEELQSSDYQNRTCECFARAMEQYWATKKNQLDLLALWNAKKNHPEQKVFEEKIMPLCEQFLKENDSLLKAFFRHFKDGKLIYRRIK